MNSEQRLSTTPPPNIEVGSPVAYSVQWLKSVGLSHSEYSHARGKVLELQPLGSNFMATIEWDNEDVPAKVLASNLAIVGPNPRFCAC